MNTLPFFHIRIEIPLCLQAMNIPMNISDIMKKLETGALLRKVSQSGQIFDFNVMREEWLM